MSESEDNDHQDPRLAGSPFHYTLARRITHDLKAPIRQIVQLTDMLMQNNEGELKEETLQSLTMMRDRASKMAPLVDALRSLSNSFTRPLAMQNVVLNDILTDVLIDSNLPSNLPEPENSISIWTDRNFSSLIFHNLVQNFFLSQDPKDRGQLLLKPTDNGESGQHLEILITNYPHEIHEEIELLDFATRSQQDLMQILLIAESAQAAERLGWKVFLHTNNKRDLCLKVCF